MVSQGISWIQQFLWVAGLLVLTGAICAGQAEQPQQLDGRDGRNLALGNFRPKPTLNVRQTLLEKAQFQNLLF